MSTPLLTLGVGFGTHDTGACLVRGGDVLMAVEEERLTREKHTSAFPVASLRTCLSQAKVTLKDIDAVALTGRPVKFLYGLASLLRLGLGRRDVLPQCRYVVRQAWDVSSVPRLLASSLPGTPKSSLRYTWFDHHRCHAAASFYSSGYDAAAVLVLDGVGDHDTITVWDASADALRRIARVGFPHSLGKLYGAVCRYLGFSGGTKEGTVMALAAYGKPRFQKALEESLFWKDELPRVRPGYFVMGITPLQPSRVSAQFEARFGLSRHPQDNLTEHHVDMASSLQRTLEGALLRIVRRVQHVTARRHLCLSGGVALNCRAVGTLREAAVFRNVHVPCAPHDGGLALGAAFLASGQRVGGSIRGKAAHPYLGPSFTPEAVVEAARSFGLRPEKLGYPVPIAARFLSAGRIVGWFQGALEYGPRALGNRSILADPRLMTLRERLNGVVKRRQPFQPFAPAVLDVMASEVFVGCTAAPRYMTESFEVHRRWRDRIPAILHVDGTARVQTVRRLDNERFYELIREFCRLTGIPLVLNTSLNLRDEPIVATPTDALQMLVESDLDCLFIGDFLFERHRG